MYRLRFFISTVAVFPLVALMTPLVSSAQVNSCDTNSALYGMPGNYTFTVPSGVTQIRVAVIGAGGGGGAGSGGWGSGGGGGCGGAIAGGTMSVTPGQKIPLYVGYGGTGGNGSNQANPGGCPWCGFYDASSNGAVGGTSGIDSITAVGGGWGRTGYHNLFNQYAGGSGGGSGGGGGGNGWYIIYGAPPGRGGTAGGQTNNQGAGGYCTGGGWSTDLSQYIKNVSFTAGAGGYAPGGNVYWGGGGGGGVVINSSTVKGGDGVGSPNNGGKGYGGGGGGAGVEYTGAGGNGAPGAVYIEWNGGDGVNSCALSCTISFDKNPLTGGSTKIRWSSQNASLFYINSIGYVSGSGSAQVSSPGDYSGQVTGIGSTASCAAVLQGNNSCTPTSQMCQASGDVLDSCGQTTVCRYGCSTATNQCNEVAQCQALSVCDAEGNKVVNACDGSTVSDCSAQGLMCVAGACVVPSVSFVPFTPLDQNGNVFSSGGHLTAVPALVSAGQPTHVYWNVKDALDCSITGSNGDGTAESTTGVWNMLTSGTAGKVSSGLMSKTIYTLLCHANVGAVPDMVQESVTVNVAPSFQEL